MLAVRSLCGYNAEIGDYKVSTSFRHFLLLNGPTIETAERRARTLIKSVVYRMQAKNSRRKSARRQAAKVPKLHKTGQWYIYACRKFHYYGRDEEAACAEWDRVKDYVLAGKTPPPRMPDALTVAWLCNLFMAVKDARLDSGEIAACTRRDWRLCCERIVEHFGATTPVEHLGPAEFLGYRARLTERHKSMQVLGYWIARTKSVFTFAYENDEIDRPVRFGVGFKAPGKKAVRKQKYAREAEHGKRLFTPGQILALLDAANIHLRAMIALGINFGFNNADCGSLPILAVDWEKGIVSYPRHKTIVERPYLPMWPETLGWLRASLKKRHTPTQPEADGTVFVTKKGMTYHDDRAKRHPISWTFYQLAKKQGIYPPGLSFSTLRHTFETVAGDSKDQVAVDAIMGHVDGSMAGEYREGIAPSRIDAAVEHVRAWLFSG